MLLYLLCHFECDGHTVHVLTQWCLLPPLSSTVKSSLFTHARSSPLSLAARLHRCHTNRSHYTNNGWTFLHIDLTHSGANVGLQLFTWKIIQQLINNNTRINSVFPIFTTVNQLLPNPVYVYIYIYTYIHMYIHTCVYTYLKEY